MTVNQGDAASDPLPSPGDVTALLMAWGEGDRAAFDDLVPLVYEELRRLARAKMRGERGGHSLQTTALVNEAYLRLVDYRRVQARDRVHFLGIAAQAMRRILIDRARSRRAEKRDGGQAVALDESLPQLATEPALARAGELVALDEALARLAAVDARKARVVELKYFGGLTNDETAAVLAISGATVEREWSLARAWLRREIAAT